MTRLPDLERQLLEAARQREATGTLPARRRRSITLITGLAALAVTGAAAAAITGVLDSGEPVPQERKADRLGALKPGTSVVLPLRVPDPDGGPPWGIAVFDVAPRQLAGTTAAGATIRCVRRARIQNGQIGVVGRDGLFDDDGRFHPQPEFASTTGTCTATSRNGQLLLSAGGAPTPASGYSGSIETPIGGCLLFRPKRATSSPETRRRLRGKKLCSQRGLRIVKYGFVGRDADTVTISNDRITRSAKPGPDGEFMFVLRASDAERQQVRLTVRYRDGTRCTASDLFPRGGARRRPAPECSPPPGF